MEYLQVFDINKNKLNEKIGRNNKFDLPKGKYFMIILLFIENDNGDFLLQKTSKSRNSCIATTGGHVTYGDSGLETVVKEAKEELGIDILPNDVDYVDTFIFRNAFLETYYAKMNIDIKLLKLQTEEVESVDWYSKDDIEKLIKNGELREGNIKPYKKVIDYIGTTKRK